MSTSIYLLVYCNIAKKKKILYHKYFPRRWINVAFMLLSLM
uniref:Uncharacterized protein n=1 Tax=Arundo donax TaxID=35708 RepID=A0A0A9H2G1_ARUDO